jgi:hypothetical protein
MSELFGARLIRVSSSWSFSSTVPELIGELLRRKLGAVASALVAQLLRGGPISLSLHSCAVWTGNATTADALLKSHISGARASRGKVISEVQALSVDRYLPQEPKQATVALVRSVCASWSTGLRTDNERSAQAYADELERPTLGGSVGITVLVELAAFIVAVAVIPNTSLILLCQIRECAGLLRGQ